MGCQPRRISVADHDGDIHVVSVKIDLRQRGANLQVDIRCEAVELCEPWRQPLNGEGRIDVEGQGLALRIRRRQFYGGIDIVECTGQCLLQFA